MRKKRIYISGQITGKDDYMERFRAAEMKLRREGYAPINPAEMNAPLAHSGGEFTHDEYMEICMAALNLADAIYMMDGWENSQGACDEYAIAKERNMDVVYDIDEDHLLNGAKDIAGVMQRNLAESEGICDGDYVKVDISIQEFAIHCINKLVYYCNELRRESKEHDQN